MSLPGDITAADVRKEILSSETYGYFMKVAQLNEADMEFCLVTDVDRFLTRPLPHVVRIQFDALLRRLRNPKHMNVLKTHLRDSEHVQKH
jgi:hypothetical protein